MQDGLGSTRQLATHEGVITMSVAYTPWGDVLEYYGSGGIDFGYLGGMYDDTTGLIYLGSGQYYDPVTGRMLTRGAGESNPYKPGAFDPAGMMVAPLALIGLALGKKKKRGKWDTLIILLVVGVVVGMSVSACNQPPTSEPTADPNQQAVATQVAVYFNETALANSTPIPTMTVTVMPSPSAAPAQVTKKGKCTMKFITKDIANDGAIENTLQELVSYTFGEAMQIKELRSVDNKVLANPASTKEYLRRLMNKAGEEGLNTNHLAYIYATTHIESGWYDFTEFYEGDPDDWFEDLYGIGSGREKYLGNLDRGDASLYMGRGFIHLTGRGNYAKVDERLKYLEFSLEANPGYAACGKNCKLNDDYVTEIAVMGMKLGIFTDMKLEDYDIPTGYDFYGARAIINWPGAQGGEPLRQAGDLGIGYAKILSENCMAGGVSEGLECVVCQ